MENVFPAYDKVPLMLKGGIRTPWVGGHAQNECMPSFIAPFSWGFRRYGSLLQVVQKYCLLLFFHWLPIFSCPSCLWWCLDTSWSCPDTPVESVSGHHPSFLQKKTNKMDWARGRQGKKWSRPGNAQRPTIFFPLYIFRSLPSLNLNLFWFFLT